MAFQTPEYPGISLDDNYGPQLNAICIAFICISAVTVVLRIISRWRSDVGFGRDDWLLFVSAVLCWTYTAVIIVETDRNFYGQHIGKSDQEHLEEYLKGLYALAIVYPLALTTSKLSLLSLYWRIFHVPQAKLPIQIAAGLNISWTIAAILTGIFSCRPISSFWDLRIPSHCIQEYAFFAANESITMLLDVVVLLIPIWFIAQIQRSLSQRISISLTFALGLIATLISAIRLWQLVEAARRPGQDPTFNQTGAALWAVIEVNGWVVVATIPSLRQLVARGVLGWRTRRGLVRVASGRSGAEVSRLSLRWLRGLAGGRRRSGDAASDDGTLALRTRPSREMRHVAHVEAKVPPFLSLRLEECGRGAARDIHVERGVSVRIDHVETGASWLDLM